MPTSKYTSFQIKNTAEVPMEISLTDPDGDAYKVELDPGEQSIQVAPTGTIWAVKFVSSEPPKSGRETSMPGIKPRKSGTEKPMPGVEPSNSETEKPRPGADMHA